MVSAGADFSGEETMQLQAAVLLYANQNSGAFATVHNIAFNEKGIPQLLQGSPLTTEILNSLAAALVKGAESKRNFNGYLPENVLAVGIGSIVWWLPAADRPVSFSCTDELIGVSNGITPHPPLVFGVNNKGWYAFAVKDNVRPKLDTKLWQAPYFNVWDSGKICQGSTRVPPGATTQQIEEWNHAFFASNFSHPNVHAAGKLVKYKGGPFRFWRDMLDGKFRRFPLRTLVEAQCSLNDFITIIVNGSEL